LPTHNDIVNYFHEIEAEKPYEIIMKQISNLINKNFLKPGDQLPPERTLAETFHVSRAQVREAIKRLESYNILKTIPQSGTYISEQGFGSLRSLIDGVLILNGAYINPIIEIWNVLEKLAVRLAALNSTKKDINNLSQTNTEFQTCIRKNNMAFKEDLLFHLKISEICKNPALMTINKGITAFVFDHLSKLKIKMNDFFNKSLEHHNLIIHHISTKEVAEAESAMEKHNTLIIEKIKLGK